MREAPITASAPSTGALREARQIDPVSKGKIPRLNAPGILLAAFQAERDFYSNQMVELQTHNRVLTEAATQYSLQVQELEHVLTDVATERAKRVHDLEQQLSKQSTELVAKIEELSKQSALDRPLVFMAAPKTSSSALAIGLCEVLPSTAHILGYDHAFFGAFRQFEGMSPGLRQEIYETLPPASGIDFVFGEMAYSTLIQGRPTARLMTVLREPRSRILSLWMYWRSFPDEDGAIAGAWGRVRRLTRQPLAEFLNHPEAACQTDNVYVRRLLWPHPLIPDDGFIDSASDERLTSEAAVRLKAFDFADVIENPRLEDNVRAFLARPFVYRRVNETPPHAIRASGSPGARTHPRSTASCRALFAPRPRALAGLGRRAHRRSGPDSSERRHVPPDSHTARGAHAS